MGKWDMLWNGWYRPENEGQRTYIPSKAKIRKKLRRERKKAKRIQTVSVSGDKFRDFYDSKEWKYARYKALQRMGGRCMCCGASAAEGRQMNVDHIKSVRYHWRLRLDQNNLQVLCSDCNVGKGARDDTDWRPRVVWDEDATWDDLEDST